MRDVRQRIPMNEDKHRLHDTIIKWLSVPLAIAGFTIALLTYVGQQSEARSQAATIEKDRLAAAAAEESGRIEREKRDAIVRAESYRSQFWQSQLRLYLEATKAASTLATASDSKSPSYQEARARFDQLYYGELCVVESSDVSGRMVDFRKLLIAVEEGVQSRELLKSASMSLARACRKSSEDVWNIQLGELPDERP